MAELHEWRVIIEDAVLGHQEYFGFSEQDARYTFGLWKEDEDIQSMALLCESKVIEEVGAMKLYLFNVYDGGDLIDAHGEWAENEEQARSQAIERLGQEYRLELYSVEPQV